MAHQSAITEFSSSVQACRFGRSRLLSDYWALTKPEVNFLILITTFVGFYLGSASDRSFHLRGYSTLALTALAAELYNILAFHLTLAPASIAPALVASVLWVLVFFQYRESFKGIFSAKPATQA
jgi:hypothetical protein